jgi:uncharacterized protein (TIGR02284 family)
MERDRVFDRLKALMNLDYDAIKGYDRAIDDIENAGVQEQLRLFRGDHERHVSGYRDLMQRLGGRAEEPHRDLKGLFVEAMAAIQSEMGTKSALKAVESAEKMVNSRYEEALDEDLPPEARDVVSRNYGDEQRHLAYVRQALMKEAAA